jgi:hypothetical protein
MLTEHGSNMTYESYTALGGKTYNDLYDEAYAGAEVKYFGEKMYNSSDNYDPEIYHDATEVTGKQSIERFA